MWRDIVLSGGRVLAVITGAIGWALNLVEVSDLSGVFVLSTVVFVGLTGIREYVLYTRPKPQVEFHDLFPTTRQVEIRTLDEHGNSQLERKMGHFQRVRLQNRAAEAAGE